jgi:hypothetical protein
MSEEKSANASASNVARKPAQHAAKERLYIHELLDISVKNRRAYLDWFSTWAENTAKSPELQRFRNFGVWGTVGYSHRWPEGVVMWENPSKLALAANGRQAWEHFYGDMAGDVWGFAWKDAPDGVRDTQGMDRLICSTAYSPTMEELIAKGVKGEFYIHNHIVTRPGEIDDHLERLGRDWIPIAERLGLKFVGAYRTLFVNDDQGISLWAAPTWEAWADFEDKRRTDPEALDWRAEVSARGVTWDGRMLVGARANPLDTGVLL